MTGDIYNPQFLPFRLDETPAGQGRGLRLRDYLDYANDHEWLLDHSGSMERRGGFDPRRVRGSHIKEAAIEPGTRFILNDIDPDFNEPGRLHGQEVEYLYPDRSYPGTHYVQLPGVGHPLWVTDHMINHKPSYYHLAPTSERARIMTHGLKAANPTFRNPWLKETPGKGVNATGVYATREPEQADQLADLFPKEFGSTGWDVWKINHPNSPEPDLDSGHHVFLHDIEPQHLSLHMPWEENPGNPDIPSERPMRGRNPAQGELDALEENKREWGIGYPKPPARSPLLDVREHYGKTADYYHQAPTSERARIQQHGLIPARPGLSERWETSPAAGRRKIRKQPEGVYVTEGDPFSEMPWDENFDTWRIPADQVQETMKDKMTGHDIIPHRVWPVLHEPFENSEKAGILKHEEDLENHVMPEDGVWDMVQYLWNARDPSGEWHVPSERERREDLMIGRPTPKVRKAAEAPFGLSEWRPGRRGKGLVTPSGMVYTWNVNAQDAPHHMDAVQRGRIPMRQWEGATLFAIAPSGQLDLFPQHHHPSVITSEVPGTWVPEAEPISNYDNEWNYAA